MDIEKLKILSKKASEAGELMKEVTAFKNFLKDKEHMHDITMSEHFKTLRDPLIEQQKKTDDKQDKVIEQLQKKSVGFDEWDSRYPEQRITTNYAGRRGRSVGRAARIYRTRC